MDVPRRALPRRKQPENNFPGPHSTGGFPGGSVVKNPPANARAVRDMGSIPGSGRSPGGGHGNPLRYSCLDNHVERKVWWATVHGVTKSWERLNRLSMHTVWVWENWTQTRSVCFCFLPLPPATSVSRLAPSDEPGWPGSGEHPVYSLGWCVERPA